MSPVRHTFTLIVVACLLYACSGRPRIIPRSVLTDIYAEMFLADQWLEDHSGERSKADTSLFYDPIFRRYGYTFEDYDASVQHYLKDPEKFSKIFRDASFKLKDKRDFYKKQSDRLEQIKEFNASIKGYKIQDFRKDTTIWRTPYKDSLKEAIRIMDSLMRDSLYLDSLRLDSLRRDSLMRDSIKNKFSGKILPRNIVQNRLIKNTL